MFEQIRRDFDPLVTMQRVADGILELVPKSGGALIGVIEGTQVAFVRGSGFLAGHVGTRVDGAHSLSGLAVASNETLLCGDTETDERVDRSACRRLGVRSSICVPMRRRGLPVGVVTVSSPFPDAFDAEDVERLARVAEFVGVAVWSNADLSGATASLSLGMIDGNNSTALLEERFATAILDPDLLSELDLRARVSEVVKTKAYGTVFQPIFDLRDGRLLAVEALCRFASNPYRAPDVWIAEAHRAAMGVELELDIVERALEAMALLPDRVRMSVNLGPQALLSPRLTDVLSKVDPKSIIIELTEHVDILDYLEVTSVLGELRSQGMWLAIDDTGAGISSLNHILRLAPDLIKLDRSLTTGIDIDPVRRSLAKALREFSVDTGAAIVAEGIENDSELGVLMELGVPYGQGFHLARPKQITEMPTSFEVGASSEIS